MPLTVLPSQTCGFPPGDLAKAREIADRVVTLVNSRSEYVKAKGGDPAFAYPDANWAYGAPNGFVELFRCVARCHPETIGQLRAFTQVFSGLNLYEMREGVGLPPGRLDRYTDDAVAATLE